MKNNSSKPLISIVMPVFNGSRFLSEAVESILNQTYKNIELLIVDDCSKDDSWKIIKGFQKQYPGIIKAVRLKKNRNSAGNGAVNAVLKKLKGKYYARMDADDISYPQRIEKQVEYMEKHPEVILCGTQGKIINEYNEIVGNKDFPCRHEEIYNNYFIFHPVLHPSIMVRLSMIPDKSKIYEEKMGVNDDYYTFFKLLQFGKFANLPEYLVGYRLHGNNLSLKSPKKKFISSLKIRAEAVYKFNYVPTVKAGILIVVQSVVIFLIPEKFIVPLYFMIRKINISSKKTVGFEKQLASIQLQ